MSHKPHKYPQAIIPLISCLLLRPTDGWLHDIQEIPSRDLMHFQEYSFRCDLLLNERKNPAHPFVLFADIPLYVLPLSQFDLINFFSSFFLVDFRVFPLFFRWRNREALRKGDMIIILFIKHSFYLIKLIEENKWKFSDPKRITEPQPHFHSLVHSSTLSVAACGFQFVLLLAVVGI